MPKFVVSKAGKYYFQTRLYFQLADGVYAVCQLNKNESEILQGYSSSSVADGANHCIVSGILDASVSDEFSVSFHHYDTTGKTIYGNKLITYFMGHLLK